MDFPDHFKHIFQQLNHQRLHAQLCNCVVLVGTQSFQAHSSILAACSSHFRALLSSTEGDEGGVPGTDGGGAGVPSVIELDPGVVTPEAFSTLLDMIYTSTLIVGASNVMDVLLAASHLHLNTVVKACKLHLSKRNFPTSPPKGWRSPMQQQHQQSPSSQTAIMAGANSTQQRSVQLQRLGLVTSALEWELIEGEAGVEVIHPHGDENGRVGVIEVSGEQRTAFSTRYKRKSPFHEERPSSRQKTCRLSGQRYGDGPPTVASNREEVGEALPSPDSLKTGEGPLLLLLESKDEEGEGEVEEKYETGKGDFEERQLPSQSDSSVAGAWEEGGADGEIVVKVKVGEEGEEEEEEMETVEVKRENLSSSSSPDLVAAPDKLIPSTEYCTDHLDELVNFDKTSPSPPEGDCSSSNPQSYTVPHASHTEGGDGGVESIDSEGLDSLSDLALSCFLNPSSESVMGELEVEESLANLTATTTNPTTNEAHAVVGDSGESSQNSEATNTCSAPSSASSLVFPVTSIPFQPLLHTRGQSFSDTLILQPSQSSLSGILGGIKSGLSLQAPFLQPSMVGKTGTCGGLGAPAFRRIAPKVVPGSEARTDPQSPSSSSGSVGDAVHHPPLTRASEDVLSKCKKAASADHVLLVEGEKKYACRICCKTFMNLTDCKKHIRVHTGEKPYPCPKCGKRFSQSSHLYKHCNNTCLHWRNGPQLPPSQSTESEVYVPERDFI